MGLLEMRAGNQQEARKWYGEAVALHSTSFLAYYNFAALSAQAGHVHADDPSDEQIKQAFAKAEELNPQYAPAAASLAFFDAAHEDLPGAAQNIVRAVQLAPTNLSYRLEAAQIRVQRGDLPNAVAVLKAADKLAKTPEEHERVQARLASVTRLQEQSAEAEKAPARAAPQP